MTTVAETELCVQNIVTTIEMEVVLGRAKGNFPLESAARLNTRPGDQIGPTSQSTTLLSREWEHHCSYSPFYENQDIRYAMTWLLPGRKKPNYLLD